MHEPAGCSAASSFLKTASRSTCENFGQVMSGADPMELRLPSYAIFYGGNGADSMGASSALVCYLPSRGCWHGATAFFVLHNSIVASHLLCQDARRTAKIAVAR